MKFIPGYEDLYSATEDGLIFGHKRQKYLKQRLNENGYYRVILSILGHRFGSTPASGTKI